MTHDELDLSSDSPHADDADTKPEKPADDIPSRSSRRQARRTRKAAHNARRRDLKHANLPTKRP